MAMTFSFFNVISVRQLASVPSHVMLTIMLIVGVDSFYRHFEIVISFIYFFVSDERWQ